MTVETIIQNIVLPTDRYQDARTLYAKGYDGSFPIRLSRGESIDLRTFFNVFPSEKYRKFAGLDHVMLRLDCKGNPLIEISRYSDEDYKEESVRYSDDLLIDLRDEHLLGLVIKADESDVAINSGCFYVDRETVNEVHLAHVICTYRREKDIKEKLDWICAIMDDDALIGDNTTVYVIDNGHSFDYQNENVKVVPSPNLGGSGGFTRGMIEAIHDGMSTHVTLNDDDAMLDPETIHRTIAFYRLLLDERKETILSGTIFVEDDPIFVHEAGAFCRSGKLYFNEEIDASEIEGCLRIENGLKGDEKDAYVAWCYMTMPCDIIRRYRFSLPLFFQCDDVDYSLRTKDIPKITMCGISVWHPFSKTHSVNKEYFSTRNMLTAMASNSLLDNETLKHAFLNIMVNVGCSRYRSAEAQIQALRDFIAGPDKIFGMITKGYSLFDEYKQEESTADKKLAPGNIEHSKRFNIMTFNGILFPSIGNLETDMSSYETTLFYRKGIVYYVLPNGKEVVCKRSFTKAMSLLFRTVWNIGRIKIRKGRINRRYSESSVDYSSEDHWNTLYGHDE